jgi:hypothetical protein
MATSNAYTDQQAGCSCLSVQLTRHQTEKPDVSNSEDFPSSHTHSYSEALCQTHPGTNEIGILTYLVGVVMV